MHNVKYALYYMGKPTAAVQQSKQVCRCTVHYPLSHAKVRKKRESNRGEKTPPFCSKIEADDVALGGETPIVTTKVPTMVSG